MKEQKYLCVDMKTYTHETMKEGQAIFGMMEMTEQDEQFEFQQTAPIHAGRHQRNHKIFRGAHFSLTRNKNGAYHISACEVAIPPMANRKFIALVWDWVQDLKDLFAVIYWNCYHKQVKH